MLLCQLNGDNINPTKHYQSRTRVGSIILPQAYASPYLAIRARARSTDYVPGTSIDVMPGYGHLQATIFPA